MIVELVRIIFDNRSTEGELSIDGVFECFTLELPVKDGKPGSAIPPGLYDIVFAPSPKFQKSEDPWVKQYADAMPHIEGIDGRSLIMLHWGNDPTETDGCVLVGQVRSTDFVGSSRPAFSAMYDKIRPAVLAGRCKIAVMGGAARTGGN